MTSPPHTSGCRGAFSPACVRLALAAGRIARACEEILLSSGLADEAYARYALAANRRTTFLTTFRAIAKKYPTKAPAKILDDLVESTPGQQGKWFAVQSGLAALRWIAAGYGYEITGLDVLAACSSTMNAARNGRLVDEAEGRIRAPVAGRRSTAKDLIAASLGTRTNS